MGFVKRGAFKSKGSGKGSLWESSRRPLHLAYSYDSKEPSRSLETMQLKAAPRGVPSLEGVYHGGYDVNLYRMERLPPRCTRLLMRDTASRALEAFEAGYKVLRHRLRQRKVYVIRKQYGSGTRYCEVKLPDCSGLQAYAGGLSTHTEDGVWQIFLMDFDESHVDCMRGFPRAWKDAKDLKGHDAVVTAIRYALGSGMDAEDPKGRDAAATVIRYASGSGRGGSAASRSCIASDL
jgi:hypothetical protein